MLTINFFFWYDFNTFSCILCRWYTYFTGGTMHSKNIFFCISCLPFIFFPYFCTFRAWILRIDGQKEKNNNEIETSSDDEDEPVDVVSKKRKPVQLVKPNVNTNGGKKKKSKNNGLLQESQVMESDTDSE